LNGTAAGFRWLRGKIQHHDGEKGSKKIVITRHTQNLIQKQMPEEGTFREAFKIVKQIQ
jgi:hypothetical protein